MKNKLAEDNELEQARALLQKKFISVGDSVVFDKVDTCIYEGLYKNQPGVVAMIRLNYKGADELHSVHYSRLTKLL